MATAPIYSSLAELQAALAQLPAPSPGMHRVFRGQNRDFGAMIPSGIRRRTREYWSYWHRHAMLAVHVESDLRVAAERMQPSTLDLLMYWVHAIAQHYGGDSNYLDVSHDVESALWFALYELQPSTVRIVMGEGSALDAQHDKKVAFRFWKYEPWTEAPAFLYVFDAPMWHVGSALTHGALIDIMAQAPELVSASTRMAVQRACLLYADSAQGDLAPRYVCPPLRVAWPFRGSARLDLTTNDVFPPPARDAWFARFCAIGLGPTIGHDGTVALERPLPVAQYVPRDQEQIDDVLGRLDADDPVLSVNAMREAMRDGGASAEDVARLAASRVVVLEAALMALLPVPSDGAWNLELLLESLPDRVPVYDFDGAVLEHVDTNNLYFEFSTLERTAERSRTGKRPTEYVRGVWLTRTSDAVRAAVYVASGGSGAALPACAVVVGSHGDLALVDGDSAMPTVLTTQLRRPIYTALFALAWLAGGEKIAPFAGAAIDVDSPTGVRIGLVDSIPVQLWRARAPFEGVDVHVLRQGREPFCGPAAGGGAFAVPASRLFGRMSAADLRGFASAGSSSGAP